MNFRRVIKSQGIGEIFVDHDDETCYMADSSLFDRKRMEIPFFKLFLEINSLYYKYERYLQDENIFDRIAITELYRQNIKLLKSFEHLEELCDSLYCTGEINDHIDAIINFYNFMNNEPFEFYYDIFGEIREIMDLIFIELEFFKKQLNKIIEILPYFIKNQKLGSENLILLKKDFIKQMLYR